MRAAASAWCRRTCADLACVARRVSLASHTTSLWPEFGLVGAQTHQAHHWFFLHFFIFAAVSNVLEIKMRNVSKAIRCVVCVCGTLVLSAGVSAETPTPGGQVVNQSVYDQLAGSSDGTVHVIVMLRLAANAAVNTAQVQAAVSQVQDRVLSKLTADEFTPAYVYKNFAAMTGRVGAAALAKLAVDPDVVGVGLDGQGGGHLSEAVPFIGADVVHASGLTGAGVTVAVLDTGIDTDHPDLSDDVAAGAFHFLNQGSTVGVGAEDDNGHGTNVSGIITSRGVVSSVGVAPDADILAVKVLDASSSGWVSDWVAGIDYVVTWKANNPSANLRAINMSLGTFSLFSSCPCDNSDTFTQLLQASLLAARNAGIVTFASSGNQGSCTSMSSPACLSSVAAVAAVYDQNMGREPNSGTYSSNFGSSFGNCFDDPTVGGKITCFSNRSACNALAAPGRLITAPGVGGGLSSFTGTSQASPQCAAVAALMSQKCDNTGGSLSPTETLQIMEDTGVATTDPCSTFPNPIRVDAALAVSVACQVIGVPEPLESTGEVAKTNRYLRFVAPPGVLPVVVDEVVRVRILALDGFVVPSLNVFYVGPPFAAPEEDSSQLGLTFIAARLQCEPYSQDWGVLGVISAYGGEIMPGSTYELQRAASDCPNLATNEACWSTPLTITTAKFADVVAPFFVNPGDIEPSFQDISAFVQKFLATPGAPIKAVVQLQPNVVFPDRPIDFKDINAAVLSFLNATYFDMSFATGPCVCPSLVTCGATTCLTDVECGGGLCVDGACADACGRCSP